MKCCHNIVVLLSLLLLVAPAWGGGITHSLPTMPSGATAAGDEYWDDRFCHPGMNSNVFALAGSDTNLYAGGMFTQAGGLNIRSLARWNGRTWQQVGGGISGTIPYVENGGSVYSIVINGTDVYVGGSFMQAGGITVNGIAKWDGSAWSALGGGCDNPVRCMLIHGDYLYVGGEFDSVDGMPSGGLARWNLTTHTWSRIGALADSMDYGVMSIAFMGDTLFAGGDFLHAGPITANHVAYWDGSSWHAMGTGVQWGIGYMNPSWVSAVAVHGHDVFVGGNFTNVDGATINHLARWNSGAWSSIGVPSVNAPIDVITVDGDILYIGGLFSLVNGDSSIQIGGYNTSTDSVVHLDRGLWASDPPIVNYPVMAIACTENNIFAGGYFVNNDYVLAEYVARWNRAAHTWRAMGRGINNPGYSLGFRTDESYKIFAGGYLGRAGGVLLNGIGQWDGAEWSKLGLGVRSGVFAIASTATDLYVGGYLFKYAEISGANNIARWNYESQTWSTLGSGLVGGWGANAIAVRGADVFAGGEFTTAGGSTANHIARWDGTNWYPLGSGVNGTVRAIAVTDSFVYVGGDFTTAGGITANYIARWDGANWSPVGTGANNGTDYRVYAIAIDGNDIYVGGSFEHAGTVAANIVAKWNTITQTWSALGTGVTGTIVQAMAIEESNLFIGGAFTAAGGTSVSNLARWDGDQWYALGSGVNGAVNALLNPSGRELYVAGAFTAAGGKVSENIALWTGPITRRPPTPPIPLVPPDLATCLPTTVAFTWDSTGKGVNTYNIQIALNPDFSPTAIDTVGVHGRTFTATGLLPERTYYWRAQAVTTSGVSLWSTTFRFSTGPAPRTAPRLAIPRDSSQYLNPIITFRWHPICTAGSYQFQTALDTGFTSIVHNVNGLSDTVYIDSIHLTWTRMYWRMRSVHGADTSDWSTVWTFTTGGELTAPLLLTPADSTAGVPFHFTFSWNRVGPGFSYQLQLSTTSEFTSRTQFETIDTVIVMHLPSNNSRFYWRVRACIGPDTSAWSTVWTFRFMGPPTLISPVDSAMGVPFHFTFSWNRVGPGLGYQLQLSTTPEFTTCTQFETPDTILIIHLPNNDGRFYWHVRAAIGTDTSDWSTIWTFRFMGPPTLVTPIDSATGVPFHFTFDWHTIGAGFTYQLQLSTAPDFLSHTQFETPATEIVTHLPLNNGQIYWRVRACIGTDTSDWSIVRTFQLMGPPELITPADSATDIAGDASLQWHRAGTDFTYQLQIGTHSDFDNASLFSRSDTSFQSYSFLPDTRYYWGVRSINGTDTSDWSPGRTFVTGHYLTIPTPGEPADSAEGISRTPHFHWCPAPSATGYHIQASRNAEFSDIIFDSTGIADTSVTLPCLTGGCQYFWRVQGYNSTDTSAWSPARTFRTVNEVTSTFTVQPRWNIVSVPVVASNMHKSVLFPGVSTMAFGYTPGPGYQPADSLCNGYGYWLRFETAQPMTISGTPVAAETVEVHTGWNLLGGLSTAIGPANIHGQETGFIFSPIFVYRVTGYQTVDSVQPGTGYWLRVNRDGHVIISATALGATASDGGDKP